MKKFTALVFLFIISSAYCQKDSEFTQYMYNTINLNPAYAGSRGTTNVFALYHLPWTGIEGAPRSTNVSVNMPTGKQLGLGFSIDNETKGPSVENNLSVDFSYSIPAWEKYTVSFGLKATANILDVDFNKLNIEHDDDLIFQNNIDNQFSPNIGLGLYVYSENSYFGLSTPYLLEAEHYDKYATSQAKDFIIKEKINFYVMAGYVFKLNPSLDLKTAGLVKAVKNQKTQIDLSANFLINQKFTTALNYTWDKSIKILFGFQVTKTWLLGYTYGMDNTDFTNINSGSHEFFLRWELFNKQNLGSSPKFF